MFRLIKKIIGLLVSIVNASNHTTCVFSCKNVKFNIPLLIFILMDRVKNFTIIHLQLN